MHNGTYDEAKKNQQCYICDKLFSCKQNLNRHMKIQHMVESNKSPSVLCPLCEKTFNTILILDKHITESHNIQLKVEEKVFDSIQGMVLIF